MKICPKCGKENADISKKCVDCDTDLDQPINEEDTNAVSDEEKLAYIKKNKYSKVGTVGFVLSIISLFLSLISYIVFPDISITSFGLAIAASILGHKGIYDSRGKAGMILGIIGIFAGLVGIILLIVYLFNFYNSHVSPI